MEIKKGFTLVELLVVVGIFTLLSTVVLANHARFSNSVLLDSLAYDIALSVREAQVYGISVRGFSDDFQIGYGLHFSSPTSYLLFADVDTNRHYDQGVDAIVSAYTLSRGQFVARFCGVTTEGAEECSDTEAITFLDILFYRPETDAIMYGNGPDAYSEGKVTVESNSGETRTVVVASTGQISVQNP